MTSGLKTGSKSRLRRWERYKADIPIRVIVKHELRVQIVDGRGNALNEGGMAVFAGTELKPGDKVTVEFTPAYADAPLRVDAKIRNRTGYSYGLEFLTHTNTQKQQAEEFRKHLMTLARPADS